jgi:alpha-galactosidase
LPPQATPEESRSLEQWVERSFGKPQAVSESQASAVPFSFTFGGTPSKDCLPQWEYSSERTAIAAGWRQNIQYRDPKSGLAIHCDLTVHTDAAAADWVLSLENQGQADAPIVSDLMPLDCANVFDAQNAQSSSGDVVLRWSQGDGCTAESFLPHDEPLASGQTRAFQGDASNTAHLPFFNVKSPDAGCIVAVGWTGYWKAEFNRSATGQVAVRAGMQKTGFLLKPGERIRTPSVLLLRYQGREMARGHNQFRRMVMSYYVPRVDGKPIQPPVALNTVAGLYLRPARKRTGSDRLSEATELAAISLLAKLGGDAYWMDAYWYPQPWMDNIGNWYPRPEDYPRGLRPLADAAHQQGLKFILWFVGAYAAHDTEMAKKYPECFYGGQPGGTKGGLWNFSDPNACETLIRWVLERQDQWKFDVYREDAGVGYAPPDEPNRLGINEMRHFTGFYHFWSELLKRRPGLVIDSCNGGGRRIDLETMKLSYVLWRSDFNDIGEGTKEEAYWPMMGRADQVMVSGLSLYCPLHTGPVWGVHPYNFRSAMSQGIVFYNDFEDPNFPVEEARKGIAELKELRPLFVGDFYPLLPITMSQGDWYAYQMDRPDLRQGYAFVFRRPESQETAKEIHLQAIDPNAEYSVTITGETYDKGPVQRMRGSDLRTRHIEIAEKPGSVLIQYTRIAP